MSAIQRMIDEMQRRGYAKKTIAEYSGSVRRLATYFGKCPSKLTLEQLREYQLHLAKREDLSVSYYNATVTALRFLYLQTLERDWSIDRLPYGRREHRLPIVLSRQEVFALWRPRFTPLRRSAKP
jgi:site-specific recombinase XerD